MERAVPVKEFKIQATRFLNGKDEIVITKRGQPVALLTPLKSQSPEALMTNIGNVLREAHISKQDVEEALKVIRRRLYGSRRS